jgi:O-glycosyl hydrolase
MIAAALLAAALLAGCSGSSGGEAGATAQAKVTISSVEQYQRIAGFGLSEGFGQAKTLMNAPASVQQQVLSLLYSPTRGAGLTILRNEISADKGFTIEPKAPGSPNGKPSYLALAEVDQDQGQLWFAKQIKADYGVSDVFADAWSAPAFMKTNDSAINGGTLCGVSGASCKSGDWRQAYADYLVQYAKDYAAAGVPLTYVGPENETTIAPPQDSMIMSPAQTANLMGILGATFARSGPVFRRARSAAPASAGTTRSSSRPRSRPIRQQTRLRRCSRATATSSHQTRRCVAGANQSGRPNGRRLASSHGTRPGTTAHRRPDSLGRRTSTPA